MLLVKAQQAAAPAQPDAAVGDDDEEFNSIVAGIDGNINGVLQDDIDFLSNFLGDANNSDDAAGTPDAIEHSRGGLGGEPDVNAVDEEAPGHLQGLPHEEVLKIGGRELRLHIVGESVTFTHVHGNVFVVGGTLLEVVAVGQGLEVRADDGEVFDDPELAQVLR
jgi:hypothetical protein